MSTRLNVLISAYACEPGKGSEPEVGWQWCLQMARFHDITVVTRANNRTNIENALAELPEGQAVPTFVYFDGGPLLLWLKSRFEATRFYYIWWQRSIRRVIGELSREQKFDLIHHVTFAGYRYITGIWGHGVPSIWGPIGGMESIAMRLLPYRYPIELLTELTRNLNNFIQSSPTAAFPSRARQCQLTLVTTQETQAILSNWDIACVLMPTVALVIADFPLRVSYDVTAPRPLRLLFVGQLIWLKGVDLAIKALAASKTDATLHFIGSGPFRENLEKMVIKLGLSERVSFSPRIPRSQVLKEIYDYDVFVFPSLHDSGGFAMLEAMAAGMPTICLAVGGPALAVADDCGFRIPIGKRKQVIADLAKKLEFYNENREAVEVHGRHARSQIELNYNWDRKGELMNELYHNVALQSETISK